jgi:hypothetical protein
MAETQLRIAGDRPSPFIFCSKNFALRKYGATITATSDGESIENASFPALNIIDGNRKSFGQLEKVGSEKPAGGNNFLQLKFDISNSGFGDDSDDEINLILLENDIYYPARRLTVTSYTSSDFSTGAVQHNIDELWYTSFGGQFIYTRGAQPRIDGNDLTMAFDPVAKDIVEGLDGRFGFILLDEPIANDHPYVKIEIMSTGRNIVGWDGTFDDGLWALSDDELLITSDPAGTGEGTNNNHIHIFTDTGTGGHQADQYTKWINWSGRLNSTYILHYWHKMIGLFPVGDLKGYTTEIKYYNSAGTLLSTEELLYDTGVLALSWAERREIINYVDVTDGKRYSGDTTFKHLVPDGAVMFQVRWKVQWNSDPTADELDWKLDDIAIYNTTYVPGKKKDYISYGYGSSFHFLHDIRDLDGMCRIRRIGMHMVDFGMSKASGKKAFLQDIASMGGANPTNMVDKSGSKIAIRNINGDIISQFVPRAGIKYEKTISFLSNRYLRAKILDFEAQSDPFGLITPDGDFADYIITPGSLTFTAADSEKDRKFDPVSGGYKEQEYLFNTSMSLKEI